MSRRVLCVGGVGVDTIVRVPTLPLPFVDTVHVPPVETHVGHSGTGYAVGLAALGHRVNVVDLLGEDAEAALAADFFAARGVRLHPLRVAAGTKRSINLVDPAGRRLSLYDGRGQGRPEPTWQVLDPLLADADHVHVTINDWTRPVQQAARARGLTVSVDLHDWDGRNDYHRGFAGAADVLLLSSVALGGDAAADEVCRGLLGAAGARVVVRTAGAAGSVVYRWGRSPVTIPAVSLPDRPVLDTNGAGDAFGAALLDGWFRGLSWDNAARRAAVSGAWACGAPGAASDPIGHADLDARSGLRDAAG